MCQITSPIERVCRQMADLEFELEQRLCEATETEKWNALGLMRRRGDTRAADILNDYLPPAMAEVDSAVASLVVDPRQIGDSTPILDRTGKVPV